MLIETGPFGAFPKWCGSTRLVVDQGASDALGHDPDETNADIAVSISPQ
jgi:hypothetical protein